MASSTRSLLSLPPSSPPATREAPREKPPLPDHSGESFLAAWSNSGPYLQPDSDDEGFDTAADGDLDYADYPSEDEDARLPIPYDPKTSTRLLDWWTGVYSSQPESQRLYKEMKLLKACRTGNAVTLLKLIGPSQQKSEVDLGCSVHVNAPHQPQWSGLRRKVMYNLSPFHVCCKYGHVDLVDYLIKREECAFLTRCSKTGATPLHDAVEGGHLDVVKSLVRENRVENMTPLYDNQGRTPVYLAAQRGRVDMVKFFITQTYRRKVGEGGAVRLNICRKNNQTMYHLCARSGNVELLKLLLERGGGDNMADVNIPDDKGLRPIHYCAGVFNRKEPTVMGGDAANGSRGGSSRALARRASVSAKGISLASECFSQVGHDVIKLLVEAGADCNTQDVLGRTTLHFAAMYNNLPCTTYLCDELDADMLRLYASAFTAQDIALAAGYNNIAFFLRDRKKAKDDAKKKLKEEANRDQHERRKKELEQKGIVKQLMSKEDMALVKEFSQGRNLLVLDKLYFPSWQEKEKCVKKQSIANIF